MSQSVFPTAPTPGTVEQWTTVNTSGEIDPFHLHQTHAETSSARTSSKTSPRRPADVLLQRR